MNRHENYPTVRFIKNFFLIARPAAASPFPPFALYVGFLGGPGAELQINFPRDAPF